MIWLPPPALVALRLLNVTVETPPPALAVVDGQSLMPFVCGRKRRHDIDS